LSGFLLSGFLFAFPGAILPVWGYHRDPPDFVTIGNYFLAICLGVIASGQIANRLLIRRGVGFVLIFSCVLGCATLLYLALVSPPVSAWWRVAGLFLLGLDTGMLNRSLFQALSGPYQTAPAATVSKGGILYGAGCLGVTVLAAGALDAYTVPSLLVLMAAVPGCFAAAYANSSFAGIESRHLTLRHALRDFRSLGAVLFALLLFCQFGNEWSIAGWLPLFLIRRLGTSPRAALEILSLYWLALLVGRIGAVALLSRLRHGRILLVSVIAALFGCFLLFLTNNVFGAAVGTLLVGIGFASIYPLVAEGISRRFPYYNPGLFSGIFSFALLGGMLAPATLGYAAASWGIGVVIALPLFGTCLAVVLLLMIWLESKVTGE